MLNLVLFGLLAAFLAMTVLWLISLAVRDSSIVDMFWGLGLAGLGVLYFVLAPQGFDARKWLAIILVVVWGGRLGVYLIWRNFGKPEDFRYQEMRANVGAGWWWVSYFQVYLLQGVIMWLVSITLIPAQFSAQPAALTWLDYLGASFWVIGIFFETVGDWQLARFKANPNNKGKVLNTGLWRYTRHPNYFGDFMVWWGLFLISLAAGGWWVVFGPIIMSVMLMRVSGVSLLESTLKETKPQYAEYIANTSAFFPWFPRQPKG